MCLLLAYGEQREREGEPKKKHHLNYFMFPNWHFLSENEANLSFFCRLYYDGE